MSGKSIAWIVAEYGIAAVGAVVALLATGFFEAAEPVGSPFTLQDAEASDLDEAPPAATPSSPAPRHRGPPPEIALAERLLDDIPSGAKVALQPLDQRYAGLEAAMGDPLYERLLLALTNAAEDGVTLLARERLRAIYNSLEEFYQGDIESLLRNTQADIEIICKPTSNAAGIILSCSAVRLVNAVTLATAAAHFPITRRAAHFDVAIDAIASGLAQGAPPGTVTLVPLLDTGVETTLTRRIDERLENKIATTMAKRLGSRAAEAAANAALGDGQASGSEVPRYRLRGELRRLDDQRFRVDARLLLGSASQGKRCSRRPNPSASSCEAMRRCGWGVFAWAADDRVVRLYPTNAQRQLTMDSGEVLVLPSQGEGRTRAEPFRMEGNHEDHEALVVVAATEQLDYRALTPAAAALATARPMRNSISILSYQVHL